MPSGLVVAEEMKAWSAAAMKEVEHQVTWYANLALGKVRANASGRPGPRHVHGDYKRSMNVEHVSPFIASIGTSAPQARRLEFGFVGTDALGRHYNQPPYPHWGPMADQIEEPFLNAIERAVTP